jgi:hypothetical protein
MVCTFICTFCKKTTCITWSLKQCSRCYWSAIDCDGRATVVQVGWRRWCLEDCWECCSSLRRAVQWSPMKPESWSGWFPQSSPTCSCCWLHCDLQNVSREHAKCTAGTARANWSEASLLLTGWTELRLIRNCLQADPSANTARNNTWCVCWLKWKSCFSACYLDTDLRKRYLVTGIPNMWDVSMEGSHTTNYMSLWSKDNDYQRVSTFFWTTSVEYFLHLHFSVKIVMLPAFHSIHPHPVSEKAILTVAHF